LWQDEERRAEIGFHDGRIVSAWTPGHEKLGSLLIQAGILDAPTLDEALEFQKGDGKGDSIGHILLDRGAISRQDIHRVIKEQVEATIFELVTWKHGRFHFEVDELHPVDEIGLAPDDLLDNLDLNTQMVLLEAARLFDERHRKEQRDGDDEELSDLDRRLRLAGFGDGSKPDNVEFRDGQQPSTAESAPVLETLRCQVVSEDGELLMALREGLPSDQVRVVLVRFREAGNRMPGETSSPIVVLDLRQNGLDADHVATLARTRPTSSVVAMVSSAAAAPAVLKAGAISVATDENGLAIDCCRNLIRVFSQPQPQAIPFPRRGGFSRFRRVLFDVQSGLLSATMALNLMNVISESVERAVLFLVQGNDLTAVGGFGFAKRGQSLARSASGLRLHPQEGSALRKALDDSTPQSVPFAKADLPDAFAELLGPPANGQIVVFPVLGAERVISVIYTDNGTLDEEIQDIKILELATAQVGVAFENELLRQKVKDGSLEPVLE
ncbi:MAG: DUF4388 domain-containing protein, partial [Thermoanaerobaculia bacterium]